MRNTVRTQISKSMTQQFFEIEFSKTNFRRISMKKTPLLDVIYASEFTPASTLDTMLQ
jgi:hypothetical protein